MMDVGAIYAAAARAVVPKRRMLVSDWADSHRVLSSKGSAFPGRWKTSRNPPLREPMDCMSVTSDVRVIAVMFPIQSGKSDGIAVNAAGYSITENPGPIMACLPGEVSREKWVVQKFNPMVEETEVVRQAFTSLASRDSANTRNFKDFIGGQIFLEHAGSPQRLKSSSARILIVDELDEFAAVLSTGDDPVAMLDGRTSAFPSSYKRLYISTPTMRGTSRIANLYEQSDQRRYYVPCPHCGERQPLVWAGLQWSPDASSCWYMCRACACVIEENQKTAIIAAGGWVAENPGARIRGYHLNCLYYPFGLGPRWLELVHMWREAQNDIAKLKTFVNDRLAEPFEDPSMRSVKHSIIADRAEPYRLRTAPVEVLTITAGVDTQDNRLAVHVIGWGRGMQAWTLDYVELPGDPADDAVWVSLTELLNRPIEHAIGGVLRVEAVAIDAGGHRTEAVKNFARSGKLRRCMAIFGAIPNNAPALSKPKLQDVTWSGRTDRRGVHIYHVGTVGIKHVLYSRIGADAERAPEARQVRFSDELPKDFFAGLVSETYNPTKNRFEKKTGARNEPLDTWVYAYAAGHHPELRLHRRTKSDWDAAEAYIRTSVPQVPHETPQQAAASTARNEEVQSATASKRRSGWGDTTTQRGWK